jgi:hypothetical protein
MHICIRCMSRRISGQMERLSHYEKLPSRFVVIQCLCYVNTNES